MKNARSTSLSALRLFFSELLPVLLVLYPLLLLADDAEPGFVRSVFNPHWFLLAIIVAAILSGNTESGMPWSRRAVRAWSVGAGVVVGIWMWWKVGGGTLGMVVALVAATAVGMIVLTTTDASQEIPRA